MYKIAVLDDDELWCFALQRFLKNNFEVSTFGYANLLLEELEKHTQQYDLVMVDLSLPADRYAGIDGRKLIRDIRQTLSEPPLLVLVTAFIGKNELESGEINCEEADAFLAKDAGLEEILRCLQKLFAAKKDGHSSSVKNPGRTRW